MFAASTKFVYMYKLLISLMLPLTVGWISGAASVDAMGDWFRQLKKPDLYPPGWAFGAAWTVLYVLMGYASCRIWQLPEGHEKREALYIYAIQLFLNFWWSFIFFKFKLTGWALAELVLILVLVIWMVFKFYRLDPIAALLNLPLLCWLCFAGYLNWNIYRLNP